MRKLWLGALVAAVAMTATSEAYARKLRYSDILGTWCGDNSKYVFTRQALTVTWTHQSGHRVLPVKEWVFSETWINVKWKPKGNTVFAEFSKDGRTMAQRPNTTGDMGPRRPFHRCK